MTLHQTIKKLPGEPIVVVTLAENYDFNTELEPGTREAFAVLDTLDEPVFWIVHILCPMDLNDLLVGASLSTRGAGALWTDPRIKKVLLVTQLDLLHAAAPGLKTEAFGHFDLQIFSELDAAIDYARNG
jgi:hypothetical protein